MENKKAEAQKRRAALKDLSNKLKELAAVGQLVGESVNDLLRQYYAGAGHTDLHTFGEWKKLGYSVKKGEKACLLWAHPKPSKNAKAEAVANGKTEEEAKDDYFPIAYLFSRKQVAKTINK